MGNFIYLFVAVLLVVVWAVVFIGFGIGGVIHILIMLAIFAVFIRGMRREMYEFNGNTKQSKEKTDA